MRIEQRRIGRDRVLVRQHRGLDILVLERKRHLRNRDQRWRVDAAGACSITLERAIGGSPSNSSRYWPDSACQRLPPSLHDDAVGHGTDRQARQRHRIRQLPAQARSSIS